MTKLSIVSCTQANRYDAAKTVRNNRLLKNDPLTPKKELENQVRRNFSSTIYWKSGKLRG